MTTPQITVPSSMPDPLQPQPNFDAVFSAALAELLTAFGQTNTVATWMNSTAGDVSDDATAAATSANAADVARIAAQLAQSIAQGAANYQGDYDAGTLYAVGESVSYLGAIFVKKTTAAAGTTPVDGTDWRAVFSEANVQTFTSSGTWTKPAGVSVVMVEAIGGGGGGGNNTGSGTAFGGGGGAYTCTTFNASDIGATETVTIGAGASGVADGVNSTQATSGGDTLFGSHVTASGGGGGLSNNDGGGGEKGGLAVNGGFGYGGYSSGGGGYSSNGGNTVKGGGGGGGVSGTGGVSLDGGDGGAGELTAATKGGNGAAPGGGGGASGNDGGGGDGGDGWCRVTSW